MDLGDLRFSVSVDSSALDDLMSKLDNVSSKASSAGSALDGLKSRLSSLSGSGAENVSSALDGAGRSAGEAKEKTDDFDSSLRNAVAAGDMLAVALENAFNTIVNVIGKAASSLSDFVGSIFDSYSELQQMAGQGVGAVQTVFGEAGAATLRDFATAAEEGASQYGLSMQEFYDIAVTLGNNLVQQNAKNRALAEQGDRESADVRKQALDDQLTDFKAALSAEETELRNSQSRSMTQWKNYYADVEEELQRNLNNELDAMRDHHEQLLSERKKELSDELEDLSDALDEEIRLRRQAMEDEYDATKRALDAEVELYRRSVDARIKEMNREYREKVASLESERKAAIAAIDDQIDKIEELAAAEEMLRKARTYSQKRQSLQEKVNSADTYAERFKAMQDLTNLEFENAQDQEKQRDKQHKKELQDEKSAISDRYSQRKQLLKDQHDAELEQYREHANDVVQQMRDANEQQLKQLKRAQQDEIREMERNRKDLVNQKKEDNARVLDEMKAGFKSEESALAETNAQKLKEQKRADAEQLANLKESQANELKELQTANQKKLAEQRNYIKEQKKLVSDSLGYVEANDEDKTMAAAQTIDMSKRIMDIANKMGVDPNKALLAITGIPEGRYALFDSLRLGGYKGKTGIEQMLSDAEDIKKATEGVDVDYEFDDFTDIIEALGVVVDQLGLTGSTIEESEHSVQGSLKALSASWQNLLGVISGEVVDESTGMTEFGMTIEDAVDQFFNRLGIAFDNAAPVIGRIMENLAALVGEKMPEFFDIVREHFVANLPEDVQDSLGGFVNSIEGVFNSLKGAAENLGGLSGIINSIADTMSSFADKSQGLIDILGRIAPYFDEIAKVIAGFVVASTIVDVATKIKDFTKTLGGLKGGFDTFLAGVNSGQITGFFADLVTKVGAANTPMEAFKAIVGSVPEALNGLKGGLSGVTGALGPIGTGIAVGTAAFALMYKESESLRDAVAKLGEGFKAFTDGIGQILSPIRDKAGPIIETLKEAVKNCGDAVANILNPAIDAFKDIVGPMWQSTVEVCKGVVEKFMGVFQSLADIVKTLSELFPPLGEVIGKISGPIGGLFGLFTDVVLGIVQAIATAFGLLFDALNGLLGIINDVLKGIKDFFGGIQKAWEENPIVQTIGGLFNDMGKSTEEQINKWQEDSNTWMTNAVNNIRPGEEAVGKLAEEGKNIAKTFGDSATTTLEEETKPAIQEKLDGCVTEAASNIESSKDQLSASSSAAASSVGEGFNTTIDNEVIPSISGTKEKVESAFSDSDKWLNSDGSNTAEGYRAGFRDGFELSVGSYFENMEEKVKASFEGADKWLFGKGEETAQGYKDGFENRWKDVDAFVASAKEKLLKPFEGSGEWLKASGTGIVNGLKTGIDEAWKGVGTFLDSAKDKVQKPFEGSGEWLRASGSKVIEGLKGGMDSKWTDVEKFVDSIDESIEKHFEKAGEWLTDDGENVMAGLLDGMEGSFDKVTTFMGELRGKLDDEFVNADQWLVVNGKNIIIGLYNGMVESWNENVVPFVQDMGNWIQANDGPEQEDKALLYGNGMWMMEGLFNGLRDGFRNDVAPFVNGMSDALGDALTPSGMDTRDMLGPINDFASDVIDVFDDLGDRIGETMESALSRVSGTVESIGNPFNGRVAVPVSSSGSDSPPPVNVYMTYNAGEDATRLVTDLTRQLRAYGYATGTIGRTA